MWCQFFCLILRLIINYTTMSFLSKLFGRQKPKADTATEQPKAEAKTEKPQADVAADPNLQAFIQLAQQYCNETSSYNQMPSTPITRATHLGRDMNFDDIDICEITMMIEKHFGVEMEDDQMINGLKGPNCTVGNLLALYKL